MTDSEGTGLNQDIELIKKVLSEQEDPATARKKYAKLWNLMHTFIPLDAAAIKNESAIDWENQKNEAIKCIREAASRLADPSLAGKTPVLAEHWEEISQEERANLGYPISLDLSNPEILGRCIEHGFVSYALNQIANTMSEIPGDKFRQAQYHDLLGIDASKIGVKGGTNSPDHGRTKALLVKELDDIIPPTIPNRGSLIARLSHRRFPKITRQYVNATLKPKTPSKEQSNIADSFLLGKRKG